MPSAPEPKQFKRIILITGATDGLGKQIAHSLASNYHENFVIVHGRCPAKCEQTVQQILADNKLEASQQNVAFVAADFSNFKEVIAMADDIKARFPRLNTFIACASVLISRRTATADGLELSFQINHLSHFYLWTTLLNVFERNAPSRIVTVGSSLHAMGTIDYNDLMCEKSYDKYMQYARTKLMNHMITFRLHRVLLQHGLRFSVTANVIDAEEPAENRHDVTCLSASRGYLCSRGNALATVQRLVESPDLIGVSGKYFDSSGKAIRSSTDAQDERAQAKLWSIDEDFCGRMSSTNSSTPTEVMHLGSLEAARNHMLMKATNNNLEKVPLTSI